MPDAMPRWCIFRSGRRVAGTRDDDAGLRDMLNALTHLAKEYTKVNGTGERNFGCSRN